MLDNNHNSVKCVVASNPERQNFWKDKRDATLESKYAEIAPRIPHVDVKLKDLFLKKCREYYEEMQGMVQGVKEIDRWDEYEIVRMFGKGLNPTSLKTALNNIDYFISKVSTDNEYIRVVEYGPGSGWSTLMLRNQLRRKFPDKKIEIFSVDISPHSIVATQNSLDYYQIPWQTSVVGCNVEEIQGNKDTHLTLILDDFVEFSKKQPDNYFNGYFSSHGTAYLSEEEYVALLEVLKDKSRDSAVFVADSLDPLYTVNLDTLHLILCSLFPAISSNMKEYTYGKSLVSNSKHFSGQEVKKLIKVNNKESVLFYKWNNYLLSRLKIGYIAQMLKSIRITTDVIEEYREDVYPSYLVNDLVKRENINSWIVQNDVPDCPLYITNCGLILKK